MQISIPEYFEGHSCSKNENFSPCHFVIYDNFFPDSIYRKLCTIFKERLSKGLHETPMKNMFVRIDPGLYTNAGLEPYDAYVLSWPPGIMPPLSIFYSAGLMNFFANEFSLELGKYVNGCFHFHQENSKTGFVHNDYHICNFVRSEDDRQVIPFNGGTSYQGVKDDRQGIVHPARSIALIYYLNNEESLQGGETAFYDDNKEIINKVSPVNNRALAFAVTPNSYHNFISNSCSSRSSVNLWYHSDPFYLEKKYGTAPKEF